MSKGKYSPNYVDHGSDYEYKYNAYNKQDYVERLHFAYYDEDGYDSYGYSAFDLNGEFVGVGNGIDRNGKTEMEYLSMTDEEFEDYL